jgi:serine/threonine protein kinase
VAGQDPNSQAQSGAVQDTPDPWIGQMLGSYEILRRIGFGGMGVVYLARHQSLDRLDAIKFLPEQLAHDAAYVQLFFREAKAAARLAHPNVVGVHDAGVISGVYYFVMDYVEGHDLGTLLKERGTLPVPDAISYIRQAAVALGYAHKKGIVHRDVKPENLLLTNDGVIKVADLGLAKWTGDADGTFTQGEWVLGSPVYISPERLKDPHFNDPRMDIYSLGATFYHLVTGKIPYQGSSPVIMSQHLTAPVPDPTASNPVIDPRISVIIRKMLAKELQDRYQTMEEVEAALADFQNGRASLSSALESIAQEESKGSSKTKWIVIAVLVIAAVLGGIFFFKSSAAPTPPEATVTRMAKPVEVGGSLPLADFNQSAMDLRANQMFGVQTNEAQCESRVDPGAGFESSGAWRIDFDVSRKEASARTWLKLSDVDATPYKDLIFRIRSSGESSFNLPIEVTIGPAQRRYLIRGVGPEWKMVRVPLNSLAFPSLTPMTGFTVVFEKETTSLKQGTIFIDDVVLAKE